MATAIVAPRVGELIVLRRDPRRAVRIRAVGQSALAADVGVVVVVRVGRVVEWRGGALDGVFDVEHGVVGALGGGEAVSA